jgi:CHAD domain-containing protein
VLRESLASEWRARLAQLEAGDEEARVLAASRAPLARLAGELHEALPATISPADLRRAVAGSYRKARQAFQGAVESGEEARIHAARKRVKELRYQLEWLAQVSAKRVRRRWDRLTELAQDLGEVTDLFILERAVLAHGASATPFAERIRALAAERWEDLVTERRSLFAERPRRFSKGVAKGVARGS